MKMIRDFETLVKEMDKHDTFPRLWTGLSEKKAEEIFRNHFDRGGYCFWGESNVSDNELRLGTDKGGTQEPNCHGFIGLKYCKESLCEG